MAAASRFFQLNSAQFKLRAHVSEVSEKHDGAQSGYGAYILPGKTEPQDMLQAHLLRERGFWDEAELIIRPFGTLIIPAIVVSTEYGLGLHKCLQSTGKLLLQVSFRSCHDIKRDVFL